MSSLNDLAHLKIPLENILSATNNFDDENIVRVNGFSKDYMGHLFWSGELIDVAARRLNKEREDGEQEFWMEISLLSSLKHKNLAPILGFCDENDEKIIIKKLQGRGSLRNYIEDPLLLTWVKRLKICVGLAHALSYIHYDEPRDFSIIHRNIDSCTVLLNDNWEPMLSYFELSMKIKASQRHHSFQTDKVWSANGKTISDKQYKYLAPFFLKREKEYLAPLAIFQYREKTLYDIIDRDLWKQIDP
ncbi:kinase-like domain, phloem protein 2-like protein [Tanacetum coccineum]